MHHRLSATRHLNINYRVWIKDTAKLVSVSARYTFLKMKVKQYLNGDRFPIPNLSNINHRFRMNSY